MTFPLEPFQPAAKLNLLSFAAKGANLQRTASQSLSTWEVATLSWHAADFVRCLLACRGTRVGGFKIKRTDLAPKGAGGVCCRGIRPARTTVQLPAASGADTSRAVSPQKRALQSSRAVSFPAKEGNQSQIVRGVYGLPMPTVYAPARSSSHKPFAGCMEQLTRVAPRMCLLQGA